MAEKDDARRNIEQARDSMSEIAEELMRRSSPAYMKTRAKEAAVRKSIETKERVETTVKESPMAWKLIGGAVGVGLASMLSKRYQERQRFTDYGYGYDTDYRATQWQAQPPRYDYRDSAVRADAYGYGAGTVATETYGYPTRTAPTAGVYAEPIDTSVNYEADTGPGLREKVSAKAGDLRGKASDAVGNARGVVSDKASLLGDKASMLKERVADKASTLKERAVELKHTAQDRVADARETAKERIADVRTHTGDRVHDAKLGARGRLDGVRERLPSREQMKTRANDTWRRGVEDEPLAILFGALAIGAAASFLIPVTDKERRLTAPARDRVRGKLDEVKQEAVGRLEQVRGQALEQLETLKGQAVEAAQNLTGQAVESVQNLKGQALETAQSLKGQTMDTLKGVEAEQDGAADLSEQRDLNLGGTITAHADLETGVSYAATKPPEADDQFRSSGLIQHTEGEQPKDPEIHGSYDPKLTH